MWSWNQDCFEGLREIGAAYANRPDFEHFSNYCLQKEKGLKKVANAESQKFIEQLSALPLSRQREVVVELAELREFKPRVHSLINHHIQVFMEKTLAVWVKEEPKCLEAVRFYAFFGGGQEALKVALSIDPDDQISLVRLSYWMLDDVDFMVHHLDEGVFLGDEKSARVKLIRVANMIERVEHKETQSYLLVEHRSYSSMLRVWEEYKFSNSMKPFPEWASAKGFDFRFPAKFYY
jgi:hypothetical protein